jgi:hypothetical protein
MVYLPESHSDATKEPDGNSLMLPPNINLLSSFPGSTRRFPQKNVGRQEEGNHSLRPATAAESKQGRSLKWKRLNQN